jgi:steroid delta-isomerase-like uncharacterized protein
MKSPKAVVAAWAVAFNQHSIEALRKLYAEDAVNHQVSEDPVSGRESIIQYLQEGFETYPDMGFDVVNLYEDGDWAIVEWAGWSTHKDLIDDPAYTGQQGPKLSGCGFFKVVKGKIQHQRGYWDKLSWQKLAGK